MASGRLVPLAVVAALAAGVVSACSGGEPERFQIGRVARGDVTEVVEAPATVTARATATLRSPAEGTVGRLYVGDGDRVREGQLLAKIDSPAAREQLAQAEEADRGVGGGTAVPAGFDLTAFQRKNDRSADQGFQAARKVAMKIPDLKQRAHVLTGITQAEGQYRAAADAARAAVARLNAGLGSVGSAMASLTAAQRVQTRAAVRAADRTVRALTIKAPFDGVVSLGGPAGGTPDLSGLLNRLPQQAGGQLPANLGGGAAKDAASVAPGAPVASGDAVVTVTDVSKLALSADVDETDVLRVGDDAAADVEFDAVPGGSYTARVTGTGATPQQSSGGGVTYKVTLALERGTLSGGGRAPWPKPGMSAVVDLRVREERGVLTVPSAAIVSSGRESIVWVVAFGKAQRRAVRLGAQGDAVVQVTGGLAEGERIVVRGADGVRQGQEL
ncbi:efflux RND transporter periplasmic adaptor subunit [Actinomadura hibisca]|uniref:efflux RND transporter periplasmic adaptor subunit n=1 Tax=Actinomadura hibisca TaxID=68565 RepID=UPI000A0218AD|nr:HlyD family efflux transporter periplasmic adaptor subunit [Actinomadura hibisca]